MKYQSNLQDKAAIVILNCAFSWGNVTDKQLTAEVVSDNKAVRGSLRVRKTLLPDASGAHVRKVQGILSTFYRDVHSHLTYATPIEGQRIIPVAFEMEYEEKFKGTDDAGREALEELKVAYPDSIEQARGLLGSSFNPDNYPHVSEIDGYYKFKKRFLPVPKGDQIMNALGAAAGADVDAYVAEIMETAAEDAKKRLRDAVKLMAERLTTKGAKIYDSMPDAINELAKTLPKNNPKNCEEE